MSAATNYLWDVSTFAYLSIKAVTAAYDSPSLSSGVCFMVGLKLAAGQSGEIFLC